ncbi:MAG: zinc-ribbon domain-containing protein [Ignisphaera sp.]
MNGMEYIYCPNCGRRIEKEFNYCPYCGFSLKLQDRRTRGHIVIGPHPRMLFIRGVLLLVVAIIMLLMIFSSPFSTDSTAIFFAIPIVLFIVFAVYMIYKALRGETVPTYRVEAK